MTTMGRHRASTSDTPLWVAVEHNVVLRFGANGRPNGLFIAGEITSDRLRSLRLNRWEHIDPATTELPKWQQEAPPSDLEMALPFASRRARDKAIEECLDYEESTGVPHPDVTAAIADAMARDFVDTDDYYRTLAEAIQRAAPYTLSPNKALALALDISANTAAQYVNRCRKRGFLTPSKRRKK